MRIAVLAGGRTPERDVSLRSGHRVMTSLGELGHDAHLLDPGEIPLTETIQALRPDIAYLALHGKEGEDGTVQRLLDLLAIPFTGTSAFACEVAFDKVLAKDALAAAGVRTPRWAVVEGWALRDLGAGVALDLVIERVGLPCVVKPSRSGSALGVTLVRRPEDLAAAVMAALSFSGATVIESQIVGTEVAVGFAGAPLESLPAVEIVPKHGAYDYAARYTAGATDYYAPARLAVDVAQACTSQASQAVTALGLRDVARVDLIVDREERPWALEVNVSPGMTETSLLPMGAQAAGLGFAQLCDRIVGAATTRMTLSP
jgi:D-alanine-D-alanine ligase